MILNAEQNNDFEQEGKKNTEVPWVKSMVKKFCIRYSLKGSKQSPRMFTSKKKNCRRLPYLNASSREKLQSLVSLNFEGTPCRSILLEITGQLTYDCHSTFLHAQSIEIREQKTILKLDRNLIKAAKKQAI
jgi:hypothetical protein